MNKLGAVYELLFRDGRGAVIRITDYAESLDKLIDAHLKSNPDWVRLPLDSRIHFSKIICGADDVELRCGCGHTTRVLHERLPDTEENIYACNMCRSAHALRPHAVLPQVWPGLHLVKVDTTIVIPGDVWKLDGVSGATWRCVGNERMGVIPFSGPGPCRGMRYEGRYEVCRTGVLVSRTKRTQP